MCYFRPMDVGLRELRQHASDLVRRVESGESFTVTVSGRPAARLVPAERGLWRTFAEIQELFAGPEDGRWEQDRELLEVHPRDPWSEP